MLLDDDIWQGKLYRWRLGAELRRGRLRSSNRRQGSGSGGWGSPTRPMSPRQPGTLAPPSRPGPPVRPRSVPPCCAGPVTCGGSTRQRSPGGWSGRPGSLPAKGDFEIDIAARECYEASALPTRPHGELLPSRDGRLSWAERVPAGVVGVIAPFNFPLILSIRSVAPALALGNAVILKPDPRTAVSGGFLLARVFEEAGLPDGGAPGAARGRPPPEKP